MNVALLMKNLARWEQSEPALDQAISDLEALRREFPEVPEVRALLAEAHDSRGYILRVLGRPREAEPAFEAAVALADTLAAEFSGVPRHLARAATALAQLGQLVLRSPPDGAGP